MIRVPSFTCIAGCSLCGDGTALVMGAYAVVLIDNDTMIYRRTYEHYHLLLAINLAAKSGAVPRPNPPAHRCCYRLTSTATIGSQAIRSC